MEGSMESTLLSIVMAATALLFIGLAVPLIRRRVRPNRLYGFRTRRTLQDEALWYEVNEKTSRDLLWVGIGTLAITAVHAAGGISTDVFVVVVLVWMIGGVAWSVVHGLAIIRRSGK